jgi:hypothetical protein
LEANQAEEGEVIVAAVFPHVLVVAFLFFQQFDGLPAVRTGEANLAAFMIW